MKKHLLLVLAILLALPLSAAQRDTLKIEVCAPGIFRVRISPSGEFPQSLMERYGILKTDWETPAVKEHKDADIWTMSTSTHTLKVDIKAQTISLMDAAGKEIISDLFNITDG